MATTCGKWIINFNQHRRDLMSLSANPRYRPWLLMHILRGHLDSYRLINIDIFQDAHKSYSPPLACLP